MRFTKWLASGAGIAALAVLAPASMWAVTGSSGGPKAALERYLSHASDPHETSQPDVAVEIEASLPGQGKWARMRGIRRSSASGSPVFEVLGTEGDGTVKRQVISRYLSAQKNAPSRAEVAVNGANYKFHYIGSVGFGPELTYVFRVTPRKKRVGLFRGELWIDAGTGQVSHQSGRMVKMPSIFLRRIDIAQDMDARADSETKITRLSIDTRVAGLARLSIWERPVFEKSEARAEGTVAGSVPSSGF
ncbi:MAG TPA: hypothetical protein VL285_10970 [Bryobacteraceae bacterium]|jgi:hypothetical protein|nr:hypothetical protein [Bryobacteraceae bacterium]